MVKFTFPHELTVEDVKTKLGTVVVTLMATPLTVVLLQPATEYTFVIVYEASEVGETETI